MLGQVLLNLLLNARRAMLPQGGPLHMTVQTTPNGTQIEIADSGSGMSPEVISRIFEPFYSGSEAEADYDGKGLGLFFCRQIIEAHNGSIQVQSAPQRGTTFRILLPTD